MRTVSRASLGTVAVGLTLAVVPFVAACAAAPAPSCRTVALTNASTRATATYATCTVNPGDTSTNITAERRKGSYHYSVAPQGSFPYQRMVLFLGGSLSTPAGYNFLVDEAATLGYGAIDLRYPDAPTVRGVCNGKNLTNSCFANLRGETAYGANVVYPGTSTSWDSPFVSTNAYNSIVGRLVNELVWLKTHSNGYWGTFLLAAANGYSTPSGSYLPNWSKIIISGHSQGGGDAAFTGLTLPVPAHRVVMFSSPNDNVNGTPAAWITTPPKATPTTSFWGLRAEGEGIYGSGTNTNWSHLGGTGAGGTASTGYPIGNGSTYTAPSPNKTLDLSATRVTSFGNHCSTACDTYFPSALPRYWDYLFSGNGAN